MTVASSSSEGEAHAGRDAHRALGEEVRHGQAGVDALAQVMAGLAIADPVGQDDELVAADPSDQVARTHDLGEPVADAAQQFVAGLVAEEVVDRLEAVEVDEHHGGGDAVLDHRLQFVEEHGPVDESGEHVVAGEVFQRLAGLVQVADVVGGDDEALDDGVVEQVDDLEAHRLGRQLAIVHAHQYFTADRTGRDAWPSRWPRPARYPRWDRRTW